MPKVKITGFWTFFCNPKLWDIQAFLADQGQDFESEYRITSWQKDYFEKGQMGVIRVGADGRTKAQLSGRKKLEKGVYAIVEILGPPYRQKSTKTFKIEGQKGENGRYMVPIKYVRNYIGNPILFSDIEDDAVIRNDWYLLKGIQAASMPLTEEAFNKILLYGEDRSNS